MADILIKGVQIPKNCDYCNADLACAAHCIMVQRLVLPSEYDINKRHPSCPLRDVPPHGDLIDRDAIVAHYRECERNIGSDVHLELLTVHNWIEEGFVYDLLNAPVFVPSNKEETE